MTEIDGAAQGTGRRLLDKLNSPADASGLGVFRLVFGAIAFFSVVRFWAYGWIEQLYLEPRFHFTYLGFEWVRPWPAWGMYAHFALMGAAALGLCIGVASRLSALLFCLTFTYAELIEKASYLNHYYFVSLVSLLLAVMPCGAAFSVDAWHRARLGLRPQVTRAWCYALLRAQVTLLYFFAGFAKLNPDWLLAAEPLRTWLGLHADAPWIGPALATPWVAHAASYAGALYDLTIPIWLSWRRTRPLAYVTVVFFHVAVWALFPIGVFSWFMIASATIFFDPAWPRRLGARWAPTPGADGSRSGRLSMAGAALLAGHVLLQVFIPLRFLLYPGNVNWHEQGFRFAWRVMLVEKAGRVEFDVVTGSEGRRHRIYPREELTPLQYKMMSTQPDMIHEYAQHLKQRFSAEGHNQVRVFADAWASLNGRPSQRLIDPARDLGTEPRSLRPKPWILPLATSASTIRLQLAGPASR